jgi:hypothetical protein
MSANEKSRAPRQNPPDPKDRDARLKAALKANIAKRKALTRARSGDGGEVAATSADGGDGGGDD